MSFQIPIIPQHDVTQLKGITLQQICGSDDFQILWNILTIKRFFIIFIRMDICRHIIDHTLYYSGNERWKYCSIALYNVNPIFTVLPLNA